MRLESVEVGGWLPFGKSFALELPGGPIAVVGTHSGDGRRSNRAGKTSLLEAVTWCLYGVHRKRLDDAIIHRDSSEAVVAVDLGALRARRSRKRGQSTKLVVQLDGNELTGKAAQEAIERAVGMGVDDYLATSCFRQGDVEAIINRTASERLSLVAEWLQQSKWFDAKKIQSAKAVAAEQRLIANRSAVTTLANDLITDALRDAMQAEVARTRGRVVELEAQIATLQDKRVAAKQRVTIEQTTQQLQSLREEARQLRASLGGRGEAAQNRELAEQGLSRARQTHASVASQLDELVQVRHLGFQGVCPVTCEECPVAEEVTEVARAADELLEERKRAEKTASGVVRDLTSVYAEARTRESELERAATRYQALVERGKGLEATLASMETTVEVDESLEELSEQLATLQHSWREASERIGEIEQMLEAAEGSAKRHENLLASGAGLEAELRASRLALRAISSVPAKIAEQQLGELEREANELLADSGVSLRFSWQRELADKAPVCDECGYIYRDKRADECPGCHAVRGRKMAQELELLCDDGSGSEEDVRYNSGGTRAIVGSAVRLAASAMLRRLRSSQAAWAIVDEPFGPLDAENREMLARTFAGMLGSVGLEQALVVSHDPALLAALPHRIVVDKRGSASIARIE